MTLPVHLEEKHNCGVLNIRSIRNIFKIEQERFIQFFPISDENGNQFFDANTLVEALAGFLYYNGKKVPIPESPADSTLSKITHNIL